MERDKACAGPETAAGEASGVQYVPAHPLKPEQIPTSSGRVRMPRLRHDHISVQVGFALDLVMTGLPVPAVRKWHPVLYEIARLFQRDALQLIAGISCTERHGESIKSARRNLLLFSESTGFSSIAIARRIIDPVWVIRPGGLQGLPIEAGYELGMAVPIPPPDWHNR